MIIYNKITCTIVNIQSHISHWKTFIPVYAHDADNLRLNGNLRGARLALASNLFWWTTALDCGFESLYTDFRPAKKGGGGRFPIERLRSVAIEFSSKTGRFFNGLFIWGMSRDRRRMNEVSLFNSFALGLTRSLESRDCCCGRNSGKLWLSKTTLHLLRRPSGADGGRRISVVLQLRTKAGVLYSVVALRSWNIVLRKLIGQWV